MAAGDEMIDLEAVVIDPSCALKVPAAFALQRQVLPLCVVDGDFIIAMPDPSDVQTIAALRRALQMPVIAKKADPRKLQELQMKLYGSVQAVQMDASREDAVSTVDYLIRSAFMQHASDIHFDPDRDGMRVRFRIDGELEEITRIAPKLLRQK